MDMDHGLFLINPQTLIRRLQRLLNIENYRITIISAPHQTEKAAFQEFLGDVTTTFFHVNVLIKTSTTAHR